MYPFIYQNNYGKEAVAKNLTNSFVKLPTKLFRDYTITGPLNAIFKILLKAIDKNKWIDLNILREDRKNEVKSIIADIEKMLVEKNYLVWPVVKFSPGKLLCIFYFSSFLGMKYKSCCFIT